MRRSFIALGTILAVCFTTSAFAQAADAETRDATEIARIKGISVAEAKRRAALEMEASVLAQQLENDPKFSGLVVVSNSAGFEVRARFTDNSAQAIRGLSVSPGLAGALRGVDGGSSVGEQASLRGRLIALVARAKIEARIYSSPDTGRMILAVKDPSAVQSLLGDLANQVDVEREDRPLPKPVVNLQGGRQVNVAMTNGTQSGCTTGFGARNSAGTTGLLTAGHCHMATRYVAVQSGAAATTQGASLGVRSANWSGPRDFLWLTGTGHVGTNKIWDGQFERAITSVRTTTPANGVSVCKYGTATSYTCQIVKRNNATFVDTSGNTVGPLVELSTESGLTNIAQCGDSGGPIFYGNVAWGITSLGDDLGLCKGGNKLWYAQIQNISSLGLTLLTQ